MKKFLFLAAATSVALVSCVNDETMEMNSVAKKVSFDTPVFNTQTRSSFNGEVSGTTFPTTQDFAVFAWQYNGEDANWWSLAGPFWTGAKTWQNESNTNKWTTNADKKDYYWPKSPYKLAFVAYSPAELSASKVSHADRTYGLTIEDFTVESVVANQKDLMYAFQNGCTEAAHGENGAPLTFKHALSSIVFAALNTNEDNADYKINSIEVKGLFQTKGTFKELSSPQWSGSAETTNVNYSPAIATPFSVPVDNATEVTNGTSALLMIPQIVPTDATVSIEYTVTPKNGAPSYTVNTNTDGGSSDQPIKLRDFLIGGASGSVIEKWEAGKRYTYLIQFGANKKIFFVPSVTNWETGSNAQITLN